MDWKRTLKISLCLGFTAGIVGVVSAATCEGIKDFKSREAVNENGGGLYDELQIKANLCDSEPLVGILEGEKNIIPPDAFTYSTGICSLADNKQPKLTYDTNYTFVIYVDDYESLMNNQEANALNYIKINCTYIATNGARNSTGMSTYESGVPKTMKSICESNGGVYNLATISKDDSLQALFISFSIPKPADMAGGGNQTTLESVSLILDYNKTYGKVGLIQLYKGTKAEFPGKSQYMHAPCTKSNTDYTGLSALNISVPYGDSKFDVQTMQAAINCFDKGDNKYTKVVLESDNYSTNKDILNTPLDVVFKSTDSKSNVSKFTYHVTIFDNVKPSLLVNNESFTLSYKNGVTEENLLSNITFKDNYLDKGTVAVSGFDFSADFTKLGDFPYKVIGTDNSGNQTTLDTKVKVIDDIAPVITGADQMNFNCGELPSDEDILSHFSSEDEIDGKCETSIKNKTYLGHESAPGLYTLDVQSKDKSNNVSTKTITVQLSDTSGPEFYISKTYLELAYGEVLVSPEVIVAALVRNGTLEAKNYTYSEYVSGDYEPGEVLDEGEHQFTLAAYAEDGTTEYADIIINVSAKEAEEKTESFWDKVCLFFANIWTFIVNLFSLSF